MYTCLNLDMITTLNCKEGLQTFYAFIFDTVLRNKRNQYPCGVHNIELSQEIFTKNIRATYGIK